MEIPSDEKRTKQMFNGKSGRIIAMLVTSSNGCILAYQSLIAKAVSKWKLVICTKPILSIIVPWDLPVAGIYVSLLIQRNEKVTEWTIV